MTERFEAYLVQLRHELARRGSFDVRIVEEARGHLEDAIELGLQRGLSADAAEREAVARFGAPHIVAASFTSRRHQLLNRTLVGMCSFTLLATGYLSLSVVVLHPPRLNYPLWMLMAAFFITQSALTLAAVTRFRRRGWIRPSLLGGSVVLLSVGAWWLHRAISTSHFEGYALVLGSLVAVQAALTLLRLVQFDDFRHSALPD